MQLLKKYLHPYVLRMVLGLTVKITGTVMDLFLPWILSFMIDEVVPRRQLNEILLYGGLMFFCSLVAWLGNITANRMASAVARDAVQHVRYDLFRRISYLSCRQIDDFTIASLESRLTSDTYHLHQMIGMMQRLGIRAPILLLGGIALTLFLEPALALVLISVLPFVALITFRTSRKSIPLYAQVQGALDQMVRVVRENAAGIRVIKALSKTDYEKERFSQVNQQVVKREKAAAVMMAKTNPLMNLFLNTGLTMIVVVGAFRVYYGQSQTGTILAFLTYITIILNAMLSINRMFVIYSKGIASAHRIEEILEAPEELINREPADHARPVQAEFPHIEFSHVSFSYGCGPACSDEERNGTVGEAAKRGRVLSDVSFSLMRGETLGIIGATGSGKSTLIQLLMRFYDPQEGSIRIDGCDVRTICTDVLHRKFGIAFQNDVLFSDTIGENIRFGREISDERIWQAAQQAQAGEFIKRLPKGMEHPLTIRGSNLSGGQKQRLLIARALAGEPEILILDDSSSALDYRTDAQLRKALHREGSNTTTIVVAQRVSSIRNADKIIVLQAGRVIGCGTHELLLNTCQSYRKISQSQMGGMEHA